MTLYGTMTVDSFGSVLESLMVRGDPSSAMETQYIDGSCAGKQNISFYARSKNPLTAIAALDAISDKIRLQEISLTGVLCIVVSSTSIPSFVSKEDSGESIYSFTATVEYDGLNSVS